MKKVVLVLLMAFVAQLSYAQAWMEKPAGKFADAAMEEFKLSKKERDQVFDLKLEEMQKTAKMKMTVFVDQVEFVYRIQGTEISTYRDRILKPMSTLQRMQE